MAVANVTIMQSKKVDINRAASMWRAGITATDIGEYFGVTKSVIIGISSRNRKMFPYKNTKLTKKPDAEVMVKTNLPPKTLDPIEKSEYDKSRLPMAKTLVDLERNECKWPLGHSGAHIFCAAESHGRYCEHHMMRYYRPAS